MKRKSLFGLIVLNAMLLTALVAVTLVHSPQPAEAQMGARAASDYVMVAAQRRGQTHATVYAIDIRNGAILAIDPKAGKQLEAVAFRAIARDFEGRVDR